MGLWWMATLTNAQRNTMDIIYFGYAAIMRHPLTPNETYALCHTCCILHYFSKHTFFHMETERSTSQEVCGMYNVWMAHGYIVGRWSLMHAIPPLVNIQIILIRDPICLVQCPFTIVYHMGMHIVGKHHRVCSKVPGQVW